MLTWGDNLHLYWQNWTTRFTNCFGKSASRAGLAPLSLDFVLAVLFYSVARCHMKMLDSFALFSECCGLTPAENSAPQLSAHTEMGEKVGRVEVRKLVDWDKDSLVRKQSQTRYLFSNSHGQIGAQPWLGQPSFIPWDGGLGRQMLSLWMCVSPPFFSFPQCHMLIMMPYGM